MKLIRPLRSERQGYSDVLDHHVTAEVRREEVEIKGEARMADLDGLCSVSLRFDDVLTLKSLTLRFDHERALAKLERSAERTLHERIDHR